MTCLPQNKDTPRSWPLYHPPLSPQYLALSPMHGKPAAPVLLIPRELMGLGKVGATEGYNMLLEYCLSFISSQQQLTQGLVRTRTDVTQREHLSSTNTEQTTAET